MGSLFRWPVALLTMLFIIITAVVVTWADAPQPVRPASGLTAVEYVRTLEPPNFKAGHTLVPLTRFGWNLPFDLRVELAARWGYALEFSGYLTDAVADRADDASRVEHRVIRLAQRDPERFALAVILSRDLPSPEDSPEAYVQNAQGQVLLPPVWSPEAPQSAFDKAAQIRAQPLERIRRQAPIAVVINGGEYGLISPRTSNLSPRLGREVWLRDHRVAGSGQDRDWFEYVSRRKGDMERTISAAVRRAVPDRRLYVYYDAGTTTHRNSAENWRDWNFDYTTVRHYSDVPSYALYYRHGNSGFTGGRDMLTLAANGRGYEIAHGDDLAYYWVCGGWSVVGFADIDRYTGFLKCLYTLGMVGAVTGYFDRPTDANRWTSDTFRFPADSPPHWLEQKIALARVHGLFTHVEPFLRNGHLVAGPNRHRFSPDQPAYELPTGDATARVVARKMNGESKWLVTAWAAEGRSRPVTVQVSQLGRIQVQARPGGSVYVALRDEGEVRLIHLDPDALRPTADIPNLPW